MSESENKSVLLKATLTGLIATATLGLTSCSSGKMVACHGAGNQDGHSWIATSPGTCQKLAGGKAEPLPADAHVKPYDSGSYIKCYGVAAAGANDCGTKVSACGGSVKVAKAKYAWIAAPEPVCKDAGGIVGKLKS